MYNRQILLSLLTSFALSSVLLGDSIEFKNGATLSGKIIDQDSKTITINVTGTTTTYAKSDIANIDVAKKVVSPPPSPAPSLGQNKTFTEIAQTSKKEDTFDIIYPDRGSLKLADTELGSLNFGLWTYARYSNQTHIDDTYTDERGIEQKVTQTLRNDIILNKVNMQFKGWFLDERFNYMAFIWTSNSKYSSGGNIALTGSLTYKLTQNYTMGIGIQALPTTRDMELVHPRMPRVDMRSMPGEYFRASFAYGAWLEGSPTKDVYFRAMIANNMNAVGTDYDQQDDKMDTFAGGIWWQPNSPKSEQWYGGSYGDFDNHATPTGRIGLHYAHSTETSMGQADLDSPENSQIRLSGGTPIFQSSIFTTGTNDIPDGIPAMANLLELRYQLVSTDAAIKYKGFYLAGELYFRYLDKFKLKVPVNTGFSHLIDTGFSIQPSYMLIEKKLQLYAEGSQIFSDKFDDPWNAVVGLNWYPIDKPGYSQQVRVNTDVQYSPQSPVGNASLPSVAHGKGFTYTANVEMWF